MPTYHKTKADVVEALWAKMKEVGADEGLMAVVSNQTLHLVPADPLAEDGYSKLIDAMIECAWKRGVYDALHAVEMGALKGILPDARHGQN